MGFIPELPFIFNMDEAEFELKFEATLIEADKWWDNLEQEDRVQIYLKELKRLEGEVDSEVD